MRYIHEIGTSLGVNPEICKILISVKQIYQRVCVQLWMTEIVVKGVKLPFEMPTSHENAGSVPSCATPIQRAQWKMASVLYLCRPGGGQGEFQFLGLCVPQA